MKTGKVIFLVLAAMVVLLGYSLVKQREDSSRNNGSTRSAGSIMLYCAAGIKNPVVEAVAAYEKEFGVTVEIQYGGSGTLLSNIKVVNVGDLYLAADESYINIARADGFVAESIPLASIRPVIAVAKGNPKVISSVSDLMRDDVRVSLANPDAASIGRATKKLLTKMGHWAGIEEAARDRGVVKPTVNEVANDLKLGAVDAGIIWDATAQQAQYASTIDMIAIEHPANQKKQITIGVLSSSANPTRALHFARSLDAVHGLHVEK